MRVSVLINNFNYADYLDDCFQSLKNQTEPADEVIFYDDGSSDNSVEIASKYDFVTIIANPNHGQKPGFNQANGIYQAFLKSSGDIICLLDSDDFFTPDKIKMVKQTFADNPDAVLVQNASYSYVRQKIQSILDYSNGRTIDTNLYYKKNWTAYFNSTSSMSFSRKYLEKRLPLVIDENWRVWPDVRLSRPAPFFGKVISIDKPLTYYRRHDKNDSSQMNEDFEKSLQNNTQHHEYLNELIVGLGYKPISYKKSIKYKYFQLKTILPNWISLAIIKLKKSLKKKQLLPKN